MEFFDKLLGRNKTSDPLMQQRAAASPQSVDERALAQYRYMLQTAPPETIEQAHAEAFAKLSPEQRSMLLNQLTTEMPETERSAGGMMNKDDPQSLARMATRAEVRQPGAMERIFGGMGGRGVGMGGMLAGSFLTTIAGVVVGSAIAQSFLGDSSSASEQSNAEESSEEQGADEDGDMGGDAE